MNTAVPSCEILFASPHKNGFTAKLTEDFFKALSVKMSYNVIDVFKTKITPCTDCGCCKTSSCPYNGDGMDMILQRLDKADIIIVATPIYFDNVPAQLKLIIDRCQQKFMQKIHRKYNYSSKKMGIILTTAGSTMSEAQECIEKTLNLWFKTVNAELIGHFSVNDTDNQYAFNILDEEMSKVREKILGGKKYDD